MLRDDSLLEEAVMSTINVIKCYSSVTDEILGQSFRTAHWLTPNHQQREFMPTLPPLPPVKEKASWWIHLLFSFVPVFGVCCCLKSRKELGGLSELNKWAFLCSHLKSSQNAHRGREGREEENRERTRGRKGREEWEDCERWKVGESSP